MGRSRLARVIAGVVLLLVAACGGDAHEDSGIENEAVGGASREELESQAEPMTLEEAERLGIVDTSISIGDPANPDSILPPDAPLFLPIDSGESLAP